MALTKPLRERLIAQGIITPAVEPVELYSWQDRRGMIHTRPIKDKAQTERMRARLIDQEVLSPAPPPAIVIPIRAGLLEERIS